MGRTRDELNELTDTVAEIDADLEALEDCVDNCVGSKLDDLRRRVDELEKRKPERHDHHHYYIWPQPAWPVYPANPRAPYYPYKITWTAPLSVTCGSAATNSQSYSTYSCIN